MPKISLCMIVKNEEKFLPECLESVKNIVDEIIIVDTGSTDRTIDIARSYNAKVFSFKWENDFASARNESIKHATGDWILVLDADERLNQGQEKKIKKYINLNFDGLYVRVINLDKEGKPSVINEYPRLFRRKDEFKFEGKIHEQISPSILRSGGKLAKTDITITHLGYGQSDEIMNKKYERNLQILLDQFKQNPNNAYTCYHIGITKILKGEKDEGIEYLKRSIQIPREISNLSDSLGAVIYHTLGEYEIQKGNISQGLNYFVKSIKIAPHQVGAYFSAGLAHMKQSNFIFAKNFLEKALKNLYALSKGKPLETALENFIEPELIMFNLMICYFKLGNFQNSKKYILRILTSEKFYKLALDFLVAEYKSLNKNAVQIIKYIAEVKPSFDVFKILAGIQQIEGDLENAVKTLKFALEFKDDDEIKYNLGTCLVGLRKFNEAIDVLKEFLNLKESPFFNDAIKVLALSYIGAGDIHKALQCYEVLLERNPADEAVKSRIKSLAHNHLASRV
ncbi:MAG: glycosyltransferase [Candidatus Kryptonium sp.]|nr:glycosyltransferase [Candidatus Kryptonium sp.]